ncbi:MAG: GNAT family N-acetyltransferase [Chloroflexota bacterium]
MLSSIEIEQLALNAWPGINTYLYGGWVVRWANGYTKRANSATVLFDASWSAEKQRWVEDFYTKRNQRPIFRLLSFNGPEAFDVQLEQDGYERLDLTSVMTAHLQSGSIDGRCQTIPLNDWLQIFHELDQSKLGDEKKRLHHALLSQIPGQVCPMVLYVDKVPAACGLGVLDGEAIGLFDIVTGDAFRRRGLGTVLVQSILGWGEARGAKLGYLQVVAKNRPAINLYNKLGFAEQYQYWYRAR